ncbi:MAG TPA: ATP-binding protein, partial [Polyangiaceae bacterium]|nr:ATP-binding protein [Polyangiaceae bacterium]
MVTGDPGTGKSVALRLLTQRLRGMRDVMVATIDHPQSRVSDFYRELGDVFGLTLATHNRWGGFKALRSRWSEHIAQTLVRPVLIVDEAQEMLDSVFNELRLLSSNEFDSRARSKLGLDVALEALKIWRGRRGARVERLLAQARACRVEPVMRPSSLACKLNTAGRHASRTRPR